MEELQNGDLAKPYFGIWSVISPEGTVLQQFKTQSEAMTYVTNECKDVIVSIDANTCTIQLLHGAETASAA